MFLLQMKLRMSIVVVVVVVVVLEIVGENHVLSHPSPLLCIAAVLPLSKHIILKVSTFGFGTHATVCGTQG